MIRILIFILFLTPTFDSEATDPCLLHIHSKLLPECVNPCLETCCSAIQTAPATCSSAWRTESQLQMHRALLHRRQNCTLDTCGLRHPCLFSSASKLSPCFLQECTSLFTDGILNVGCATAVTAYCESSPTDDGCLALPKCSTKRHQGWYECMMRSHPSVIDDAVSTVLLLQRHARAITLTEPQYQWIAAAGCTTEAVAHRRKVQCPIAQYRAIGGNQYQGLAFDASPTNLGDTGTGPVSVTLLNVFAFIAPLALVAVFWLNDHFSSEHFLPIPSSSYLHEKV